MIACDHCQSNSPRFVAGRRCCDVRLIAGMPKNRRQIMYDKVQATEGEAALEQLKIEVTAEYRRRISTKERT